MELIALVCLLLCSACNGVFVQDDASHIQIEVFEGSNNNWLAVTLHNDDGHTRFVQIQDTLGNWANLEFVPTKGYYEYSVSEGFVFPLSLRLVSDNNDYVIVNNAIKTLSSGSTQFIDTGAPEYHSQAGSSENKPTTATLPVVARSNMLKSDEEGATGDSNMSADLLQPCEATPMKLLVPLYEYPGRSWDVVAESGRSVTTVAIINLRSGPADGPNNDYTKYMQKLADNNVDMVGYVRTAYGTRPLSDVKNDIDKWASEFPLVSGIFFGESSADIRDLSYYKDLYDYVMNTPGYKFSMLNPGMIPDERFYAISTQLVTIESYGTSILTTPSKVVPRLGECVNKDHFAAILHTTPDADLRSYINQINSMRYFGWVYVTKGPAGYLVLTPYYKVEADYIASLNRRPSAA